MCLYEMETKYPIIEIHVSCNDLSMKQSKMANILKKIEQKLFLTTQIHIMPKTS